MSPRRRIYGVDFSGSQTAGNKIWLASGRAVEDTLFIEGCYSGRDLPNGARSREECFVALTKFIETNPDAVFGLDFPFGLPSQVTDYGDWATLVEQFSVDYQSPRDLHETCKEVGRELPGDQIEYRRETDRIADAPFCPYNWRMKHQTYYGIGDLLERIVEEDTARVLPMQSPNETRPWLLEVCPSSTLKLHKFPREGYKGSDEENEKVRADIIDELTALNVFVPDNVRDQAIQDTEGDVLDSILAAESTWRAITNGIEGDANGTEGHIFI